MSFTKTIFAATTAVALIATSAAADSWRAWNIHNDGHPNTAAMDRFAELVASKTGGEVTVDVFHGGVLGSQPDAIEQVRKRLLEIDDKLEDELKTIDKDIKGIVNEAAEFSKESPEPALSELWTDIYIDATQTA